MTKEYRRDAARHEFNRSSAFAVKVGVFPSETKPY